MMIPFLLAENPQMNRKEAFEKSRQMMKGNKWATFVLDLSFIGWSLLGIITFGLVNIFFAGPYQYLTQGKYVHIYNFERCHSALNNQTPASCYYPILLLDNHAA